MSRPDPTRIASLLRELADAFEAMPPQALGNQPEPTPATAPTFVELSPAEAAPRLGVTVEALQTSLRRLEVRRGRKADPAIPIAPDVIAYRRGRRWRIRFPVG